MATKSSKPLDHLTKEEHEEAETLLKELPIKTVATLHGIFDKLDIDHNGWLTSKELKKYIRETLPGSDIQLDYAMLTFHDFILVMNKQGLLKDPQALAKGNTHKMIARATTRSGLSGRISQLSSSKRELLRKQNSKQKLTDFRMKTAQQLDSPVVQAALFSLVLVDVIVVLGELILSNTMCECCSWNVYDHHHQKSCVDFYKEKLDPVNSTYTYKEAFKQKYCVNELAGDAHAHGASEPTKFPAVTFTTASSERRALKESEDSHHGTKDDSHHGTKEGKHDGHHDDHGGHHSHFCKENMNIEQWELAFRYISIAILAILELHILLLMALLWGKFFKKWELVLDLIIITVSLVLDCVAPLLEGKQLVNIITAVVLTWRLVRIIHGAYVAAENSMKEGQQRHAKNLKRLLGIIRHSKMLIEILQSRLASGQKQNQKQAEKRTENAVDLIEIAKTPRSKELIQQILHEEEQVAAAADTSAQIFDSIDSVHKMVRETEFKLKSNIQEIMDHLHLTKSDIHSKQSMIQLGIQHRRDSRGAIAPEPNQKSESLGPDRRL